MSQTPVADLVARARAGSKDAASELVRRHWRLAWSRGFAVTGRRALADDIAQDTMVRALARLGDLDEPAAFPGWVARIATRRSLDVLRSEQRLVDLGEVPDVPVEWVGRHGDAADLRRAIAELSEDRRVVVVLRFWLDLTPSEIAATLEVPVGTVNSRIARALVEIRAALGESSRA
ncbi:RNA polymerase sigma factor [Miltoncostaea oceani]|uniref:RNA polymerase sigma factor n=1 Tax=Miltoncostaea oceani TaxID=2843216 RepID=UPI001C3DD5ED|nr:sigma-70 family RNA polymerase sigma factor [Miltoncostaea oceani]